MQDIPSLLFFCKAVICWALINVSLRTFEFPSTFLDLNVFLGHTILNIIFNAYYFFSKSTGLVPRWLHSPFISSLHRFFFQWAVDPGELFPWSDSLLARYKVDSMTPEFLCGCTVCCFCNNSTKSWKVQILRSATHTQCPPSSSPPLLVIDTR